MIHKNQFPRNESSVTRKRIKKAPLYALPTFSRDPKFKVLPLSNLSRALLCVWSCFSLGSNWNLLSQRLQEPPTSPPGRTCAMISTASRSCHPTYPARSKPPTGANHWNPYVIAAFNGNVATSRTATKSQAATSSRLVKRAITAMPGADYGMLEKDHLETEMHYGRSTQALSLGRSLWKLLALHGFHMEVSEVMVGGPSHHRHSIILILKPVATRGSIILRNLHMHPYAQWKIMKTSQALAGQPLMIFRRVAASMFVHQQKKIKKESAAKATKGKFIIPIPSPIAGTASTLSPIQSTGSWNLGNHPLRFSKLELCHAICSHSGAPNSGVAPCFDIFLPFSQDASAAGHQKDGDSGCQGLTHQ